MNITETCPCGGSIHLDDPTGRYAKDNNRDDDRYVIERHTILLLDGGDWSDASADLLSLPRGVDIDAEMARWMSWYHAEYLPSAMRWYPRKEAGPPYMSFAEWLTARCGAVRDDSIPEVRVP